MTTQSLSQSYLIKAAKRLVALKALMEVDAYSDVVREAQEAVELALKGILRQIGVDPPKQHDVGHLVKEFSDRLPADVQRHVETIAEISKRLRKEREFAFYGDIDFIPTEEYSREDAERAYQEARFVVAIAGHVIPMPEDLSLPET